MTGDLISTGGPNGRPHYFWHYWKFREGNNHIQAPVLTPDGNLALIDIGMLKICQELWSLGVQTSDCCQGSDDQPGYVGFQGNRNTVVKVLRYNNVTNIREDPYWRLPWSGVIRFDER